MVACAVPMVALTIAQCIHQVTYVVGASENVGE